jgi:hypothetical protein
MKTLGTFLEAYQGAKEKEKRQKQIQKGQIQAANTSTAAAKKGADVVRAKETDKKLTKDIKVKADQKAAMDAEAQVRRKVERDAKYKPQQQAAIAAEKKAREQKPSTETKRSKGGALALIPKAKAPKTVKGPSIPNTIKRPKNYTRPESKPAPKSEVKPAEKRAAEKHDWARKDREARKAKDAKAEQDKKKSEKDKKNRATWNTARKVLGAATKSTGNIIKKGLENKEPETKVSTGDKVDGGSRIIQRGKR